jgi:hypothetical protein
VCMRTRFPWGGRNRHPGHELHVLMNPQRVTSFPHVPLPITLWRAPHSALRGGRLLFQSVVLHPPGQLAVNGLDGRVPSLCMPGLLLAVVDLLMI